MRNPKFYPDYNSKYHIEYFLLKSNTYITNLIVPKNKNTRTSYHLKKKKIYIYLLALLYKLT